MKVTVERAQLLKSLGHVHRVVERRNTIPILGNVLVRAENARLSLKATDLDLEVTETLAAETATGGSTTVPAHMFYDIVRKLPDGAQIVLEADGDRAVLATMSTSPAIHARDGFVRNVWSPRIASTGLMRPARRFDLCRFHSS